MNETGDSDSYGNVPRNCLPYALAPFVLLLLLLMW